MTFLDGALPGQRLLDVGQTSCVRGGPGESDAGGSDHALTHVERGRHADDRKVRGALAELGAAAARTGANWTPAMISSAARSTVKRPWKNSRALTTRHPFDPLRWISASTASMTRRIVGGRIGVGQAAAERAAIADLRIAD